MHTDTASALHYYSAQGQGARLRIQAVRVKALLLSHC
jgi:hypothetical protein